MKTTVTKNEKEESFSQPSHNDDTLKHLQVRDGITRAIRSGEFAAGSRLPGERELAKRYGASHMTARRAVTEMVEADVLERRPNDGTYVRSQGHHHLSTVTVNLIYPQYQSNLLEQFLRFATEGLEARGWRYHFIPLQEGRERAAMRVLENGEPAIIMSPGGDYSPAFRRALEKARGKVVLIGNRLSEGSGVPSVLADDAQAIRLLMEHLQGAGHHAIGLVSNYPCHTIDQIQVATWRACYGAEVSPAEIDKRLIVVGASSPSAVANSTFDAVRAYLSSPLSDVTALICLSEEMTWATLAACRVTNRQVPQNISVVSSGDSVSLKFFNPPVTCVNVHIDHHIEVALELIDAALHDQYVGESFRLVAPSMINRESVAAPFEYISQTV